MENRIKPAFSSIKADDALLESTAAYLRAKRAGTTRRPRHLSLYRTVGAVAAAFLLVFGIYSYNLYFTADAYIGIDVNPSLSLTLNRAGKVIGALAFNPEGEALLEGAELRGAPYGEAAALLLSAMETQGYITDTGLVSVTVQAGDSSREQALEETLQHLVTQQLETAGAGPDVEVYTVPEEIRATAHGCHMSPAKYLAIQELLEVDTEATLEGYSHHSIQQIRERVQACHENATGAGEGGAGQGHGGGRGQGRGHHGGRGG